MKKLILFITGMVCLTVSLSAQSPPEIKPLTIGDTLPDIVFNQIMNYPTGTARLSDFENKKLLILDFWSTGCSSCVDLFPKMQALADKYPKDLQIVLFNSRTNVWHDSKAKITRILNGIKNASGVSIRLPVVLNNAVLDSCFPYQTLPQEVWLNNKGVVLAITGAAEITAENIESVINGEKVSMHTKEDIAFNLDAYSLSKLAYNDNDILKRVVSSSVIIRGYIDGLGSKMGVRHAPGGQLYTGWYMTNAPLLMIYKSAYQNEMDYPDNRILIETKDSSLFEKGHFEDTSMYSDAYSFDITVSPSTLDELHQYMQVNLEKTFNTKVADEKRMMKCYVLKSTGLPSKSISSGGKSEYHIRAMDKNKYVRNFPLKELIYIMNTRYFNIPLIDETGPDKKVNIRFPDVLTQDGIIKAFKQAGFEVEMEGRPLKVAVIQDN